MTKYRVYHKVGPDLVAIGGDYDSFQEAADAAKDYQERTGIYPSSLVVMQEGTVLYRWEAFVDEATGDR